MQNDNNHHDQDILNDTCTLHHAESVNDCLLHLGKTVLAEYGTDFLPPLFADADGTAIPATTHDDYYGHSQLSGLETEPPTMSTDPNLGETAYSYDSNPEPSPQSSGIDWSKPAT